MLLRKNITLVLPIPDCIAPALLRIALLYRRLRFGYRFRKIPLTKGKYAIVDPQDYNRLSQYNWHASVAPNTCYAARSQTCKLTGRTTKIPMHRSIIPIPKDMLCDHINHVGLDNRTANLRPATAAQNAWNRKKQSRPTSSRYKGVHKTTSNTWSADITVLGRRIHLGTFKTQTAAAKAYDSAAKTHFGDFAYTNFEFVRYPILNHILTFVKSITEFLYLFICMLISTQKSVVNKYWGRKYSNYIGLGNSPFSWRAGQLVGVALQKAFRDLFGIKVLLYRPNFAIMPQVWLVIKKPGGDVMQVNLVLCKKNGKRKMFPLPSNLTVIGRRHDCDLRIPLTSVSKRHCQLNLEEDVLTIRDLGSRNGTSVNGKTIDEAEIKAGDKVEIGALSFIFQIDGVPESFEAADEAAETAVEAEAPAEQTKQTVEQSGSAKEGLAAEPLDEVSESMAESSSLIEDLGSSDKEDTESFLEDFDMSDDDAESLLDDFDI